MVDKIKIAATSLCLFISLPLWGGTGRPRDGFLSFILVLGFLVTLLGILLLIDFIKLKVRKFLKEIGEAMGQQS
jgi:hypothetical protein